MIKTIIEDSHDYVNTYKISFLFNEPLESYGSLISQHFICSQYDISLQAMELHRLSWLNPSSKAFYILFQNFFATFSEIRKWQAAQFSTAFNKFSLQTYWNRKYYGLFSEACLNMAKLPPSSQKDTFKTQPVFKLISCLLFSKIKDWGISK